ncbi:membrane hypothetical protein [Tenacibaculum litopenaei]
MYLNNVKAKHQKKSGTIVKISTYTLFVGTLGFVEHILNFFGLQHLGGENIANIFLFTLSIALSLAMMFSAHYAGYALRKRLLKASTIAFALGGIFLGVMGYVRFISNASFILTLANLGFYATISYVSYLRAEHQAFFEMKKEIETDSIEDAKIRSGIEQEQKGYEHIAHTLKAESETYATQSVKDDFEYIQNAMRETTNVIEVIDEYEAHRTEQLKDIEKAAYNACVKHNYSN